MSDPLNVVSSNTDYDTIPVWSQMGDNADDDGAGACTAAAHGCRCDSAATLPPPLANWLNLKA